MNKERTVTNNATIFFDRDVNASELKALLKDFKGDAILLEKLVLDTNLELECNIYVIGNVETDLLWPDFTIKGDLICYGSIDAYNIDVMGCCYSKLEIDATNITVGEHFLCSDKVYANNNNITVAGDFECYSVEAGSIFVLGKMKAEQGLMSDYVEVSY